MKSHMPWKEVGYGIGALVLLAALYVGVYYATVTRTDSRETNLEELNPPQPFVQYTITTVLYGEPDYPSLESVGHDFVQSFFRPIHEVDRQLRPEHWKAKQLLPRVYEAWPSLLPASSPLPPPIPAAK